jgi:hypothetical protein
MPFSMMGMRAMAMRWIIAFALRESLPSSKDAKLAGGSPYNTMASVTAWHF